MMTTTMSPPTGLTTSHGAIAAAASAAPPAGMTSDASDASAGALLPAPVSLGYGDSAMVELAMLLTQVDAQDRKDSRQTEDAADQVAAQEENARVDEMRKKADDDEAQGLASGIGDMASGVLQIAGGFKGGDWEKILNGAAKGASGGGELASALFKGNAGREDADAAADDAQAQAALRRSSEAHEDAQAANAAIDKVEQAFDQIMQTQNATRLAAVSVRA
jgi:hypothetical protein